MDPITAIGLIASALSVAEIATVVGRGCRHLQNEFNGALEHVDNISQQTSNIDLAIREICSIVDQRPQIFPSSFEGHLSDSISAIHNIARQIQDHVRLVRTEAETSQNRAKLRHLRKSNQITEWRTTLGVQIQALMLLLQVAQLYSNDERKTFLENAPSRKLFEKASSMSAKLTKSSRELDRKGEFTKFPFDPILLESKVYRRVCESSWIREVSTSLQDGNESNGAGPASAMSVSSNSAIASEGDCASSSGGFDLAGHESHVPEFLNSTAFSPDPPTLELSASNSSEQTGKSSRTKQTRSTMATTTSAVEERSDTGIDTEKNDEDNSLGKSCMISVAVKGVRTEFTQLVIDEKSDYYEKTQEAILQVRDRVLLNGGIDPGTYCGVCVSSTIETSGQSYVHRFPLTTEFLAYAVNKVMDGVYDSFKVMARFSSPHSLGSTQLGSFCRTISGPATKSIAKHELMNIFQLAVSTGNEPLHFNIPSMATLLFIGSSEPERRVKGGFSDVWKVTCKIHTALLDQADCMANNKSADWVDTRCFAVKRLRSPSASRFRQEAEVLKTFSNLDHLHDPSPAAIYASKLLLHHARRILEQCLELADALTRLHFYLKRQNRTEVEEPGDAINYGRHGAAEYSGVSV